MFPIEDLNESQQAAVLYNDGPCLVIAGAGSGKTRVLTYKIAYLLSQGVPAGSILALTFTNKAAREMKTRISQLVGEKEARYLWMGTFHSLCARILRKEAAALGYTSDFTIYDSTDSKNLIKRIIKEKSLDDKVYKVNSIAARISMAKNYLLTETDYARNRDYTAEDSKARMPLLSDIFRRYNQQLRSDNAMDFDDLLFNMNLLLRDFPEIREKYQNGFAYVFVDEYQDTNYAQYMIVRTLAEPQQHICVVGDDAQSIYSFRGADITHILRFQKQFPNAKLFKLEQNYRSTQNIVNAANSLIKKNRGQIPKEVFSEKEKGERIHITQYADDRAEATAVANSIFVRHNKQKLPYNDFAVLYRTNAQSRALEDALRKQNIPYKVYGGTSFYQRKEIKDALAYMHLAVNPDNTEALLRIINVPARGIGETTVKKLTDFARTEGMSLNTVLHTLPNVSLGLSAATCNRLRTFVSLTDSFAAQANNATASQFAEEVLRRSGLLTAALMDNTAEGKDRYENLQELLSGIHEQEEEQKVQGNAAFSVADFLSEVTLLTDQDEKVQDDTPRVPIMTVHTAKGLEFPIVFIVGMEDKLFPSAFAETTYEMEEERRLFYVAITRAEKECHISHAMRRFRNGAVQFSSPSIFLHDIDSSFVEEVHNTYSFPSIERAGFYAEPKQPSRPSLANMTKLSSSKTSAREPVQSIFEKGCRVHHGTFGDGTVLDVYSEDGNAKIEIRFDRAGTKVLLLKFAKLEKV